jgi:O-antigen/teichoic acid export membrane protein
VSVSDAAAADPSVFERLRRQAGRPVTSSLAATAFIQLLGVLTGVLLARTLGPSGRGALAAVVLWPTMLWTVGNLGVVDSVTFLSARKTAPSRSIVSTSLGLALVQSVILILIGLVLVPIVLARQEASVVRDCLIFLASIPTSLVTLYLASVLNGTHRFVAFNVVRITVFVGNAVGLVVLAIASDLTVTSAMLAYLASQVVTVITAAALVLPHLGGMVRPERGLSREMMAYGWRSQLSSISNLLNERVDQLVISIVFAPASLGLYVVAWTMTSLSSMIGFSVALAALPAVAKADSADDRRSQAHEYVFLTALSTTAVVIPLVVLAPEILRIVFGPDFVPATDVTRILLVASIALGTGRVLGAALKGVNRPLDAGIAEGAGLAVTAVGLAVLLPLLDLKGAAITSVVVYLTSAAVGLHLANRALGTRGIHLLTPSWRRDSGG